MLFDVFKMAGNDGGGGQMIGISNCSEEAEEEEEEEERCPLSVKRRRSRIV